MNKYKIKVDFSRTYEVEGVNDYEAKNTAQFKAVEEIENLQEQFNGTDLTSRLFRAEEYQEPRNWRKETEEDGQSVATDIEDKIKSAVEDWEKENPEMVEELEEKKEDEVSFDVDDEVSEIFDKLYQDEDIHYRATEYADGNFIYNSTDAIIEALQCIDELSDYEETDKGLWEGMDSIEEQINARATYTYANAVYHSAEEAIKERLHDLIVNGECQHSYCDDDAKCIKCGKQQ